MEKNIKECEEYLKGLEIASEYNLQEEYNYCVFTLKMSPIEALEEWDLI